VPSIIKEQIISGRENATRLEGSTKNKDREEDDYKNKRLEPSPRFSD
jgi:hypothetical protein